MAPHFYPQAVSAYGAKHAIADQTKYPDYLSRGRLNPTNSQDRATDWEADIINDFKANRGKTEITLERSTRREFHQWRDRWLHTRCLHVTAQQQRLNGAIYGRQNSFRWQVNEVVAAQVVSVPIRTSAVRASISASFSWFPSSH
jgi:protein-histidine pros-kinase